MLPTPELIPFRLTAQLRSVLMPLDGTLLLRHYMMTCLERLRSAEGRESLANALEIYVNDPVVDWLKYCKAIISKRAEARAGTSGGSSSSGGGSGMLASGATADRDAMMQGAHEPTWEPRRRINNALRKLNGAHPVVLLEDELASNGHVGRCKGLLQALRKIVWRGRDVRNGDAVLSCGEQASVLIDLATDPNILARQFMGLLAWL